MGDVMDSTVIHINEGKAYGRQGKAPTGLSLTLLDYYNSLRIRNHPAFFGSSNFAVLNKLVPDELGDVFMLCRNTCTFSMVRIQHSNMINHQPS